MSINYRKTAQQRLGVIEWLRPGEYQRAEDMLQDLQALDIPRLRTGLSWADWHTPEGQKWFDWFVPKVAKTAELLPCFTYTPPSLGIEAKTSSPPRNPKAYADFLDVMISRYGRYFEWVELWNEPNNLNDWDWRLDPDWSIFTDMIGMAAHWARQRGKKTVLAGMCPTDPNWLDMMCSRGVIGLMDAVGMHGFPGTWEFDSHDWGNKVSQIRTLLDKHHLSPEIWLTEVGYSTWRHDEIIQVKKFMEVLDAPVERVYWYSGYDLHPHECHQDGFHEDERHYHFGLKAADGTPKLLYRVWAESGLQGLRHLAETVFHSGAGLSREPSTVLGEKGLTIVPPNSRKKPNLITGGAGFIGTNLAARLLEQGESVLIFDNLGRAGVERNLEWLCDTYGSDVQLEIADIRDAHLVRDAVHQSSRIFHFAAQVAVTTSIDAPQKDFDINVRGTLNILESMRQMDTPPSLLFTSTNKVYGALDNVELTRTNDRYIPADPKFSQGISEQQPLDFHSPYGCSKGAADQYVLDYARTYGIPAAVFRMSCIYGPHQFGTEDQGWVAHFLIQAMKDLPLTLYGDGRQVRDILFVDDLVNAMLLAQDNMTRVSGKAFNIGGGVENSTSLLEILARIDALTGRPCPYAFSNWRLGDQKYYVTDTRLFRELTGWKPKVDINTGLEQLYQWVSAYLLNQHTEFNHSTASPSSNGFTPSSALNPPGALKKGAMSHAYIR
ncbi:MAG TPA: GDP-mannose 4,6-dehydratase [Cellvibrio sp.]|nr:GDP-mannose 4,6-dehydratase [Cellvibrio sp.]